MYQHQVIGIRREKKGFRSDSDHIVGVCALEVLDPDGRFHDFKGKGTDDWIIDNGTVLIRSNNSWKPAPKYQARCRYWTLEEATEALRLSKLPGNPKHRFYTRQGGQKGKKVTVYAFSGLNGRRWLTTAGDAQYPGNLDVLTPRTPVPCPVKDCGVIPTNAPPVSRAY